MSKMSKENWTPEQWAAINERGSNLLVAASAGSGKTAVLVRRIIGRLLDPKERVDVDRLLVVTFTNAAAAEMRERIGHALAAALDDEARSPEDKEHLARQLTLLNRAPITTLHAFCLEVLKSHFFRLEMDPNFRIADETEGALLRLEVLEEVLEEAYENSDGEDAFARLADAYGGERGDEGLADLVLALHDFARSTPWPDRWLDEQGARFQIPPGTPMGQLPWTPVLQEEVALELTGLKAALERAVRLASRPGGPAAYLDALARDQAQVEALLAACQGTWEELGRAFEGVAWAKLAHVKKGDNVDPVLKERVGKLRDTVKKKVNAIKDGYFSRSADEAAADLNRVAPLMAALIRLVKDFDGAYAAAKGAKGLVDFGDLEHGCLKILLDPAGQEKGELVPSEVALAYRERFVEVLVDEYQDINAVQEAILELVSRPPEEGNRFMVGDVKQSIYRFRLAEPKLFMDKYRAYAQAEGAGRRIDLARNFRSRDNIVDACNYIFRQIMTPRVGEMAYDRDAELICGADYYEKEGELPYACGPVEVHLIEGEPQTGEEDQAGDEAEAPVEEESLDALQREARHTARRIRDLVDKGEVVVFDKEAKTYRPVTYRDVVVLLRATSGKADVFLEEFRLHGIPAYADLGTGYFAAPEVETVLSLLKIIDNPRQDIPLAAVLRSPLVGLTGEELAEIRLLDKGDYYDALRKAAGGPEPESALRRKAAAFLDNLERWRTLARRGTLANLIWTLYRETGYYDYVGAMPGGGGRQANLRALYDRACQYEKTSFRGLFRFLRFVERMRESGVDLGTARALGEKENVVRLMSIHKSKGLEFPVVVVAGLGKSFNLMDTRKDLLLHKDWGLGPACIDPELRLSYPTVAKAALAGLLRRESLAEEMRILYVALTRAREKLILVGTVKNLRNQAAAWCEKGDCAGWPLADADLAAAKGPMDWLGPALVRHRDSGPLREMGGWTGFAGGEAAEDPSAWTFRIVEDWKTLSLVPQASETEGEILARLRRGEALPLGEEAQAKAAEAAALLGWTYPQPGPSRCRASVTVTEIKGRFGGEEGREPFHSLTDAKAKPLAQPRFVQQEKGLTAAEKGTAFHLAMLYLDLAGDLSPAGVAAQLEAMVERGFLTPEEGQGVSPEEVAAFFASPLGRRMLGARRVWRELPFNLTLPADRVWDLTSEESQGCHVLLQGVIDCLWEEEGGWVLLDYKTDRISEGGLEELAARYKGQLALYEEALSAILRRPVKEKHLYFAQARKGLRVE